MTDSHIGSDATFVLNSSSAGTANLSHVAYVPTDVSEFLTFIESSSRLSEK